MLEQIDKDIWIAPGACVDFYGFAYPTRSVVVRLANGDVWLWSPIAYDAALAAEIDQIGPLTHLVSPNKIHHLFLTDWATHYPQAKIWGPQSTIRKRGDLAFQPPLAVQSPPDWAGEIDQFHATGSFALDEVLFYHIPSDTLIVADFSENFSEAFMARHWKPWQRKLARPWGIVEGKGHAPLEWRLSFLRRRRLKQIKRDLLARPVRNVIMAHGEVQKGGGLAFLNTSLAWI